MIPKAFITEWRQSAPWISDAWVEQDLVISRALVELFSDPFLKENLAFRGGTALYKLHFLPSARYSEDIDLVQIKAEPIGPILDRIRTILDPWLGVPKRKFKGNCVSLRYSFLSEGVESFPLKLKVEVNTREHFAEFNAITRAMFEKNLAEKSIMKDFRADILPLLRPDLKWNYQEALSLVQSNIIQYLPGDPWKGA